MWIPRELDATLADAAATRPAVVLTGCRQAGKTSLLVKSFADHTYVSLDVPMIAEEAEHSGGDFLKRTLRRSSSTRFSTLRACFVTSRRTSISIETRPGGFLITGSQDFPLMEGVTESLAGRSSVLTLHSLSAREYEAWSGKTLDREALVEWMLRAATPSCTAGGSMPSGSTVTIWPPISSVMSVRSSACAACGTSTVS